MSARTRAEIAPAATSGWFDEPGPAQDEEDRAYHLCRAAAELDWAGRASHPAAIHAHNQLAQEHLNRAYGPAGSLAALPWSPPRPSDPGTSQRGDVSEAAAVLSGLGCGR